MFAIEEIIYLSEKQNNISTNFTPVVPTSHVHACCEDTAGEDDLSLPAVRIQRGDKYPVVVSSQPPPCLL
jgi:hypothetical protein